MANESMILQAQRLPRCLNPYHQPHKDSSMRFLLIFIILTLICFSICFLVVLRKGYQPMKIYFLLLVLSISVMAQNNVKPDQWRGFILNQSTPEDALRLLGLPAKDSIERLRIFDVDSKWITSKHKEKVFRQLTYKNTQSMDKVEFSFLDGYLVMIDLDLEQETAASALSRIYGIEFIPKVSGLAESWMPGDYERNQGRIYPKTYPTVYSLGGVSTNSFIGALVNNSSVGKILRDSIGVRDTGDFPGKIARIQIISRVLENKDGSDALSADPINIQNQKNIKPVKEIENPQKTSCLLYTSPSPRD